MTRETEDITNKPNATCMPTSVQIQTKSKDVIDFNIPDGEDIAEMRINGQEIHQMHELVMATEKQKKYWISLGAFLFLSTVATLVIAIWACNRLYHLPADTAALQQVFTQTTPRQFVVGQCVYTKAGDRCVVMTATMSQEGWLYGLKKLKVDNGNGWLIKDNTTYYRHEIDIGPVQRQGELQFFDMKKLQLSPQTVS